MRCGAPGAPGTGTVTIEFADLNNNPLASGTTIAGTVAGTGISLGQPSSFTVPCTTEPTAYPFTITKAAGATTGTLTILESGKKIPADTVLYSAGRQGVTDELNVAAAVAGGDTGGRVEVNENFQTEVEHLSLIHI